MVHPTQAIEQFHAYLQRRHYAVHTQTNYMLDLHLFFARRDTPLDTISYRDIEQFLAQQHAQGFYRLGGCGKEHRLGNYKGMQIEQTGDHILA